MKDSKNKWNLVGLTSFGYGCGDFGCYTRVTIFFYILKAFI